MTLFFHLALVFFVSFAAAPTKAPVKIAAEVFPTCKRPLDFAIGKDVSIYEKCLVNQNTFCDHHGNTAECKKLEIYKKRKKRIHAGAEVDTTEACAIQKDGSYKCEQEPVKFLFQDEPTVAQPSGSPTSILNIGEEGATPAPPPTGGTTTPGLPQPATGDSSSSSGAPPPYVVQPAPPPPPGATGPNPNK